MRAEHRGAAAWSMALIMAAMAVAACVLLAACRTEFSLSGPDVNGWPESAEFSQLMTGQTRFSCHDSGLKNVFVLVDHQTGIEYLVTLTGTCPLLDADGSPLRVLEATDDGE